MKYVKYEEISLRKNPEFDEKWVQDRIAEDPKILGLGDVVLKDKERIQPRAGRLDLLLQDADASKRFEVEIQLGAVDESHIIRTIVYWDIERKRYPQYEHTAVIIAEDVTSRFLNVLSLFNGALPLIAVRMTALKNDDCVGLVFTTVMDQMTLGLVDDDEDTTDVTDRAYWMSRSSQSAMTGVDSVFEIAKELSPDLELKYNKFYISISKSGRTSGFVVFRPKKNFLRVELRLKKTEETQERLESAGLDVMDYESRSGRYRIRLDPKDIAKHRDTLKGVLKDALDASNL